MFNRPPYSSSGLRPVSHCLSHKIFFSFTFQRWIAIVLIMMKANPLCFHHKILFLYKAPNGNIQTATTVGPADRCNKT